MSHLIYSDTRCALGEGALWHPERGSLFWFDILGKRLYERDTHRQHQWQFDRMVSAAGWVDDRRLLIASERDLFVFDLTDGTETHVHDLEPGNAVTRSNDGRADPWGGFWIGTMGKNAEPGQGAIYRLYEGQLRMVYDALTIPNAICFAPGGAYAYFTDTPTRVIRRVSLDAEGWPSTAPEDWLDLRSEGLNPDGAVVDAQGNLWNAQWGAGRVACYNPDGQFLTSVGLAAGQVSCPAFGGPGLGTLFVTSAADGAGADDPLAGATFSVPTGFRGQTEARVDL
ncbi:SMP-30/gluconolactonase/LRE family protein [Aestuariicoccus sp. MJ-SS9]|uniref:SMP-30/gluconolactonase/LRE family protein n=1 Tax=Aestuariicoccus sp. MJ-SS9 TaxID=3079855 RepID=UPI002909CE92|nr:SMP-30/gluconolactonase/LRE family protein [Aestuariicoccus sp. MJ-SS9]MDU8910635.1 SMP-30/gluconolactonase/LRE family protein [Aestuariicoccus sp. MJ-SS9]